jgi:DNA polymerase-3 subunit alpha
MSFVHLHVHTQFSIADATTRIGELVKFCKDQGMPAVAITDHDNLHGAIEFTDTCKKFGIKPIYGCCLAIAARPMGEHVRRVHHVTLLAMNAVGYQNLLFLVSQAHLQAPAGGHSRISHDLLQAHNEGLIGLSGDLSGEIANALLRGETLEAKKHAERYKSWFPEGNFYIEVQQGGLLEHETLLPKLVALAEEVGLPCVATNDVHYLKCDEARAHEVLMCIGLGIQARPDTEPLPTDMLDMATAADMRQRFKGYEHLCDATVQIAERCNVTLDLGKPMLPRFPTPEGVGEADEFARLSREGLQRRIAEGQAKGKTYDKEKYEARLEREIGVIIGMDFPGYFLIVADFINWAKVNGIPVGPGRGSGAGSIVAYALRITDLDPIPYNLLFERFLNPERVSMPDFDVDFCVVRRGEVIRYVGEKYGMTRVGQIATFGTLKAKGAIRDVGRVQGVPLPDVDRIAKLIDQAIEPLDDKHKTVKDAIEADVRVRQEMEQSEVIRKLLETAQLLEGAVRNVGMHAAGVVIGRGPLWEHVPVGRGQAGENVTQFDKDDVEKAGLVKFDFLGLKNLTMIQHAVELVRQSQVPGETPFDIDHIPLDEPRAYQVVARGDTAGIFQCESNGFTQMLIQLKPTEFEDLIASGALYRPGPLGLGMHTRYIERKHKREPVEFPHEKLSEVLAETYGVIVYQEQVMQVAQILAGFSLGQADNLRRAMGKKKADEMAKWGEVFKTGAVERGVDAQVAEDTFHLMAQFAEYGFNKSHSAAYGLVTYQTAYLKALYPCEFYAALLTADQGDTDKVVQYIQHARNSGMQVLPPDINESRLSFSVVGGRIRFGLGAIKGLGEGAIENLLQARQDKGPFLSMFDLCRRVDTRKVNRKAIEVLVKSGACDGFGQPRDLVWGNVGRAVERAQEAQRDRDSAQVSLFGMLGSREVTQPDVYMPTDEAWTGRQALAFEKDVLGFYVSGHPLDRYGKELHKLECKPLMSLKDVSILKNSQPGRRQFAMVAAVVVAHREKMTQKGTRMAFTTIEDRSGQAEVVTFQKSLEKVATLLASDQPLLLRVSLDVDREDETKVRMSIEDAKPLDDAMLGMARQLRLKMTAQQCDVVKVRELRLLLQSSPGEARVLVQLSLPGRGEVLIAAGQPFRVALTDDLIGRVEKLLGRGAAAIG